MAHPHPDRDIDTGTVAARLRAALASADLARLGALLDENVRWGGAEETPETCHTRADVLNRLADRLASGVETEVIEVVPGVESVLVGLRVGHPERGGSRRQRSVYQVMTVRNGRIADIRGFPNRQAAAVQAGIDAGHAGPELMVRDVIPILNVSDLAASCAWFAKLGWARQWDWCASDGTPSFGAVASGGREIFLCLNGQGGRGRDGGPGDGGRGVWLAVWVDQVDAVHDVCLREGLEVIRPPRDEPWGVREMHVRHPDGHVLRISQSIHAH